jgi:hypothetical protein
LVESRLPGAEARLVRGGLVKLFATVWVLVASGLVTVLAPTAAASTQRISIAFALEGAGSTLGTNAAISDDLGRAVGCAVRFMSPPSCFTSGLPNSTGGIPNAQVMASGSTITFVDQESPSTRCFRVSASHAYGPPASVRATFTNPDGSQHTVGPFRMEPGTGIYVGSTPAEPGLTPGVSTPSSYGCDGGYFDGTKVVPADCADGVDNDLDRRVDFPMDIGCTSRRDTDEDDDPCLAIGSGLRVKIGTPGRDILNGSSRLDDLRGLGGNDELNGRGDGDCLYGGGGADRITGGAGRDDVDAGPGNDRVSGQAGDDEIEGGSGNDVLFGGPGNDALLGDLGNDRLVDHRGRDSFQGSWGRDYIDARDGRRDFVHCGGYAGVGGRDVAIVDRLDEVRYCEKVVRGP